LDEPKVLSDYLDRIMWQHWEVPQRTVFNAEFADELWGEMADFYARETDGLGVTEGEKEYNQERERRHRMLQNWIDAPCSKLKHLVEKFMVFLPEDRISAANLVTELEKWIPKVGEALSQFEEQKYTAKSRAFATEAELNDMKPGTTEFDLGSKFWERLLKSYKWLDTNVGMLRPQLGDNEDIPQAVRDFNAEGYRESKNKQIVRPGNLLSHDPLPPGCCRRLGRAGSVGFRIASYRLKVRRGRLWRCERGRTSNTTRGM
jgi:hypothetical protein